MPEGTETCCYRLHRVTSHTLSDEEGSSIIYPHNMVQHKLINFSLSESHSQIVTLAVKGFMKQAKLEQGEW